MFLTIPISAMGIVPNAKLWIEMRNREMAITAIISLLFSGATGIWLAYHGYAYWSLAWQQVVFISVGNVLRYFFTRWHPTFPIDLSPIRKMLGFSSKMLLTNMLTVASQNVQTFIFGRLLPIGVVGQFNQANKWNTMGHSFISGTMAQVAQPVLTNVGDDDNRRLLVLRKMLRFTAFVSFPLMLGLALVAREFIVITISDKWLPCVPLLQILCIGGAFVPLQVLMQNYIISRGRSDIHLYLVSLQIVLQVLLTLSLAPLGITAMVTAFSALNVVFLAVWYAALRRLQPLKLTDLLRDIVPFLAVAAAVMAATCYATGWIESLWPLLIARILLAAILYFIAMHLLHAAIMKECLQFIFNKDGRQKT